MTAEPSTESSISSSYSVVENLCPAPALSSSEAAFFQEPDVIPNAFSQRLSRSVPASEARLEYSDQQASQQTQNSFRALRPFAESMQPWQHHRSHELLLMYCLTVVDARNAPMAPSKSGLRPVSELRQSFQTFFVHSHPQVSASSRCLPFRLQIRRIQCSPIPML